MRSSRKSPAEERFFKSLELWNSPQAQRHDRVLEPTTDVGAAVDRMFDELLGRVSVLPS